MNPLLEDSPGFQSVLDFLGERAGLAFPPSRERDIRAAIERGMAREGAQDAARYRDILRRNARAFDDLVAELTIGETYFLREPAQFEFIRQTVLPDRLRPGDERPLRVWSAGCASGEEAYSLAIVLAEACLEPYILATDISRAALAKAAKGRYREWSLRGEGIDVARRWLRAGGDRYVVPESLKRRVTFAYLNLALDVYPSLASGVWGMDLILCRNVLIYFDANAVRRAAQRLFDSLAPGGWLITASSDPPLADLAPFEVVATDHGLFYRRPAKHAAPPEISAAVSEEIHLPAEQSGDLPNVRTFVPEAPAVTFEAIHALANINPAEAERKCEAALSDNPLIVELHYLHSVLLEGQGRSAEAAAAARRAIFLDRSLAVAHFTLGVALERLGDWEGARRAYRNARELCLARPADEAAPLADGETAGRLAEAAGAQLAILDDAQRGDIP